MKTPKLLLLLSFVALHLDAQAAASSLSQILFSSNRSGAWRLWLVNADGTELKQVTKQDTDDQDVDPMFSPDGKSVLFTSTRGGQAGVWHMALEGKDEDKTKDDQRHAYIISHRPEVRAKI